MRVSLESILSGIFEYAELQVVTLKEWVAIGTLLQATDADSTWFRHCGIFELDLESSAQVFHGVRRPCLKSASKTNYSRLEGSS